MSKKITFIAVLLLLSACEKKASLPMIIPIDTKYQNPEKLIGTSLALVAQRLGVAKNSRNQIVIDNEDMHYSLDATDNYVSYIDIALKETRPCDIKESFDSSWLLTTVGIDTTENHIEKARSQQNGDIYYDHTAKVKISVLCRENAGPISISVSQKYYMH